MEKIIVTGGNPLRGTVQISGSKNSALPIIAATLLTSEPCVIRGVPNLSDTNSFLVVVYPFPFIQAIEVTNGTAVLSCKTVPGQTYRLQWKDVFLDSTWTNLLPDVTATESTTVMTNEVSSSDQKLYRLLLVR